MTDFDIAKATESFLPAEQATQEFDSLVQQGDYIPNLKLLQTNSKEMTDESFTGRPGQFLFNSEKVMGREIKVIPCAWQGKALQFDGNTLVRQNTDPSSETFKEIAQHKDGQAGHEFLVYMIETKQFATVGYYKTATRNSQEMLQYIGKAATLYAGKARNKKGEWFQPRANPADFLVKEHQPTQEAFEEALKQFKGEQKPEGASSRER